MSKLFFQITMSLDGYVAGPNQSLEQPLGEGGEQLHEWVVKTRSWRELHGMDGGETGPNDDVARESAGEAGAVIMGRNMFGGGPGPWSDDPPWKGWWGDNPPFHAPVYVLTHHERPPLEMEGGTTFFFVTNGAEAALRQAKEAAGGKDIAIGGGAETVQQYLAAGHVNEMWLHVVPVILGGGARLLDNVGDLKLEPVQTVATPEVVHLKYRTGK
jgi:dihydrofolate reductase